MTGLVLVIRFGWSMTMTVRSARWIAGRSSAPCACRSEPGW